MDKLKEVQNNPQSCVFGLMRTKMVNLCQKDVELERNESEIQLLVGFLSVFSSLVAFIIY